MIFFIFALISSALNAQSLIKCEATYDNLDIPHQITKNSEEFYYCFGFHHGKDRAWQMDFFKRTAQGRNAEILGFSHLKQDLMMRLLDFPARAEKIWREFPTDKRRILELYAAGVNEGFKSGKVSTEFKSKDYAPEKWSPVDSITLLLLQSFDQTRKTFFRDYEEEKNKEVWGKNAEVLFDDDHMPWENTILKDGEYIKSIGTVKNTSTVKNYHKVWANFPTVFGEESGSNSWVVSAKKSKTGFALFANDPHLDLKTPIFWYWIHLKSPEKEVIGASLPGVPFIPSGTNGKVAWGLTNAYINSADAIFLDKADEKEIISFRPTVKVKWGFIEFPFFLKSFEMTKSGLPIIPLEISSDEKMVLRWTGFTLTAQDIASMFDLVDVKNVTEMDDVLKKLGLPSWNYVFADTRGDIGFRVVGKIYKSTTKTPYGLPRMKLREVLQESFLTPDEMPHVLKPKREYVYTANNRHWPSDSAFYGGRAYSFSFRGYRIDELLKGEHDVDSFKKIQCDRQAVDARFFVPKILIYIKNSEFKNWNYMSAGDSVLSALYRRFMDLVMEKWQVNEYALFRMLDSLSVEQQKDFQVLYKIAQEDINQRPWSAVHRLSFSHLSKNEEWVFSPEISGPGDNHSIDPGTSKWNSDKRIYEQSSGASMRLIVELKERPVIHLALPGPNRNYFHGRDGASWHNWGRCEYSSLKLQDF